MTPNLFTATLHGRKRYFNEGIVAGGKAYFLDNRFDRYYFEDELSDLTEVTVVPKDAVVIEGVTVQELADVLQVVGISLSNPSAPRLWQILNKIGKQIKAQLTPRMEEPKDYTTFVIANEKGFFSRYKWQKNIANDLWNSDDGDINVKWSDLENPVILSEGQVG